MLQEQEKIRSEQEIDEKICEYRKKRPDRSDEVIHKER